MPPHPPSRRRILASLGVIGVTGLAGCTETESSGSPTESRTARTTPPTTASSTPTPTSSNTEERSEDESTWDFEIGEFVERDGVDLRVGGEVYQFNGMMGLLTHTELGEEWVDTTMEVAAEYDVNAYRCWGFRAPWDPAPPTHRAPGDFDDEWFTMFDYTVARAKEAGVRLIVPLLSGVHVDASNDHTNYAPSPAAYGTWSETADYTSEPQAFIEDAQANEYFKEYIEHFLTRENHITGIEYRNEPTILLWECANELEYKSGERAGESLDFWYEDIASYIKSIDENHLVSTGMHGSMGETYQPWTERCAFVRDHRVDEIDVCTFHDYPVYPFSDGVLLRSPELAARYVEHKIDLAHDEIGKPVYCGEYGTFFDPTVERAYVSRLETEESAAGVENDAEYPNAYRSQHDDAVLVVREETIDGVDLAHRREYFRNIADVASDHAMDGMGFWRLSPDTAGESASAAERRRHRMEHNPLNVYPRDTGTLEAVREYYTTVVESSTHD